MQTVDVGEVVPITTTWWDVDQAATEPTAIALTIIKPDGSTVAVAKGAMTQGATVADWNYDQVADQAGLWRVRAVGTVDGRNVEQSSLFLVGVSSGVGPCEPWCTWDEVTACGTNVPDLSPAAREVVIDNASEILFNLSGRTYSGICTTTRSLCYACASCAPNICGCDPARGLDLGKRWPVWGVWDVTIDGVVLDPSAYAVRGRRWLVRSDGIGWPSGWNTAEPDAFRASWAFGQPVPPGARAAAAAFAVEIAKLCGTGNCSLPARITNISREGVTYTVLDSMAIIKEGRTGLALPDLWVIADRQGRKPRPGMFSPAAASVRRMA